MSIVDLQAISYLTFYHKAKLLLFIILLKVNNGMFFAPNQDKETHDKIMKTNVNGYKSFTKALTSNIRNGKCQANSR